MKFTPLLILAGCVVALLPVGAVAQDTFTFESQTDMSYLMGAPGQTLTAESNPARTAVFSNTSTLTVDPVILNKNFQFQDNNPGGGSALFGTNLSGITLVDVSSDSTTDTLNLTFSQPINSISLDFALSTFPNGVGTDTLNLVFGGNTASSAGTLDPTSGNNEGSLNLVSMTAFTSASIFLTGDTSTNYYLDNIVVAPLGTAVPEPGILMLLSASMLPLAWRMRRRV